jgi:hypothetical protein
MPTITFSAELQDSYSIAAMREVAEDIGSRIGASVRMHIEPTNDAWSAEEPDQAELQARFDRFFEELHSMTFEKPEKYFGGDPAEAAFAEIMDEKYRKMGFKL